MMHQPRQEAINVWMGLLFFYLGNKAELHQSRCDVRGPFPPIIYLSNK